MTLHPLNAEDLRWYCQRDYEGEMGRRSTMGGIIDTLRRGTVGEESPRHDPGDRELKAAARLRRIEARFRRLAPADIAALHVVYGPRRPLELRAYRSDALGLDLGNLVLALELTRALHARSNSTRPCEEWARRIGIAHELGAGGRVQRETRSRLVAQLVQTAEALVVSAHRAYEAPAGAARAA